MPLSERERIEILIINGVGNITKTQKKMCTLFDGTHSDCEPTSESTVSGIE